MIVAISISPSGAADDDGSVSAAVADAVHVIRESGLPNETNAMFTNIEGEWVRNGTWLRVGAVA